MDVLRDSSHLLRTISLPRRVGSWLLAPAFFHPQPTFDPAVMYLFGIVRNTLQVKGNFFELIWLILQCVVVLNLCWHWWHLLKRVVITSYLKLHRQVRILPVGIILQPCNYFNSMKFVACSIFLPKLIKLVSISLPVHNNGVISKYLLV